MDFAKNLLSKYGWQEGDGLGKDKQGISKPIKPNLKFDQSGLGADKINHFGNNWWERCFNDAAQNVNVKKEKNGDVIVDLKDAENTVEVSTKSYSVKKLKDSGNGVYGNNFLAADVAVSGFEMTKYKVLSDQELFNACGGRTAHKGARHGLKLSGKLARLEQQEKELLAKMEKSKSEKAGLQYKIVINTNANVEENETTSEKSQKNEKIIEHTNTDDSNRKQKKKKKFVSDELQENIVKKIKAITTENETATEKHQKNKIIENTNTDNLSRKQKKKKTKKFVSEELEENIVSIQNVEAITTENKTARIDHTNTNYSSRKQKKMKKSVSDELQEKIVLIENVEAIPTEKETTTIKSQKNEKIIEHTNTDDSSQQPKLKKKEKFVSNNEPIVKTKKSKK